jgi:ABC-type enterochelin transport system substrate-binding protein
MKAKANTLAMALCALLLAGACSDERRTTDASQTQTPPAAAAQQQAAQLTPEQLGELGAQISKNPNDAQRLLAERGLNAQSFEQAVRKVSEDPAASKRYAGSYRKAGA